MAWDGNERRRFARVRLPCKITVFIPQEHTITSHTENIGEGGIGVLINEQLDVSADVGLEIYLENQPISCKGRVVWTVEKECSSSSASSFDTGIEFCDIKEHDRAFITNLVNLLVNNRET